MITTEVSGDNITAVSPSAEPQASGTEVPVDAEVPPADPNTDLDPRQVRTQVYPSVNF